MSRCCSFFAFRMLTGLAVSCGLMALAVAQDGDVVVPKSRFDWSAPDWLMADHRSGQSSELSCPDFLLCEATEEEPAAAEDSGGSSAQSSGDSFEAELARLHQRIEQLESSEKKRAVSDKKKKEDEAKKAEDWC